MDWLVYIGFLMGAGGLAGILGCLTMLLRLRRSDVDDNFLRRRLQVLINWNMGSVMLAIAGITLIIIGLLL